MYTCFEAYFGQHNIIQIFLNKKKIREKVNKANAKNYHIGHIYNNVLWKWQCSIEYSHIKLECREYSVEYC